MVIWNQRAQISLRCSRNLSSSSNRCLLASPWGARKGSSDTGDHKTNQAEQKAVRSKMPTHLGTWDQSLTTSCWNVDWDPPIRTEIQPQLGYRHCH